MARRLNPDNASANARAQKVTLGKKKLTSTQEFKRSRRKLAASPIGQAANLAMSFLPIGRAAQIASRLNATGQVAKAAMVARRSAAAEAGRTSSRLFAEATAKSGSLGNKKFQKLAQSAWDQQWLGQNIRGTSRSLSNVASLTVPTKLSVKLARANRANSAVKQAQAELRVAQTAAKQGRPGSLAELERAQSVISGFKTRGVGKGTVGVGKGTINKKGLAALNKKPSPSGLSPRNFPKRGR
jgi:hypothetical protein